ncbi:MAG: carbohydrate ABC transporter permease [Clostridia bacterium]
MNVSKPLLKCVSIFGRLLVTATVLAPFYVALCYAFKSRMEIASSGLRFPTSFDFANFAEAIAQTNQSNMPFLKVILNTLYVTIFGTLVLTVCSAMCAYAVGRRKGKYYNLLYSLMVLTLLIPIQSYMFPLYSLLRSWKLLGTLEGFAVAKIGAQIGYSVLITTGFIKGIPLEVEEAASIDGCSTLQRFVRIVLPLMRPILFTSIVINALSVWNDFSTAFIVLNKPANYIVSLLQFAFMGTNSIQINLAFALFTMTMIPILILYFILQKYIVSGITMGSVKG